MTSATGKSATDTWHGRLTQDSGLVVGVGGEGLGLLGRDGGVPLDQGGHDTSGGLDTHGQGSDVQEEQVLGLGRSVTGQDGGLDGGTVGDGLVGVDLGWTRTRVESALKFSTTDDHCCTLNSPIGWAHGPRKSPRPTSGSWGYGWNLRPRRSR